MATPFTREQVSWLNTSLGTDFPLPAEPEPDFSFDTDVGGGMLVLYLPLSSVCVIPEVLLDVPSIGSAVSW